MAQNIYDDERFLRGYATLPRSRSGLDGAPEWADVRAQLPDLAGRAVLDLGCGFGAFARWAAARGAARVVGIDLSARMLERARGLTTASRVTYLHGDMCTIELAGAPFDVIHSSLAFHYVDALGDLLLRLRAAAAADATLVFTVEHPLFSAPSVPGWRTDAQGHMTWPLDRYLHEGWRETEWFVPGVRKYHRPLARYVNLLVGSGFRLEHLVEWAPSPAQLEAHPEWALELDRPTFLVVAARAGPGAAPVVDGARVSAPR